MDGGEFDRLARAFAQGENRRSVIKKFIGAAVGLAGAHSLTEQGEAARRGYPGPTIPTPVPPTGCAGAQVLCAGSCINRSTTECCSGAPCPAGLCTSAGICCTGGLTFCGSSCCEAGQSCCNGVCCTGVCTVNGNCCPAGNNPCGPDCCDPANSVCCDNECCFGDCYGEELCCPWDFGVVCRGNNGNFCCDSSVQKCCPRDGAANCIPFDACCADSDCSPRPETCELGTCGGDFACIYEFGCGSNQHCCGGGTCAECCPGRCLGDPCTSDDGCDIGLCRDGVCCDAECTGLCEACDIEGSLGTCIPISEMGHNGREACGGDEACAGACNGSSNGCTFSDQPCGDPQCTDDQSGVSHFVCDAVGDCVAGQIEACAPYECADGACRTTCSEGSECLTEVCNLDNTCCPDADLCTEVEIPYCCPAVADSPGIQCCLGDCCECFICADISSCPNGRGSPACCRPEDVCRSPQGWEHDGCLHSDELCIGGEVVHEIFACDGDVVCGAPCCGGASGISGPGGTCCAAATECSNGSCVATGRPCTTDFAGIVTGCTASEQCTTNEECAVGESCQTRGTCCPGHRAAEIQGTGAPFQVVRCCADDQLGDDSTTNTCGSYCINLPDFCTTSRGGWSRR